MIARFQCSMISFISTVNNKHLPFFVSYTKLKRYGPTKIHYNRCQVQNDSQV
jgi:hypothetical protein